ncbi:DUF92 domain-containing protein [Alkalihalobacillus sp. 1P02AB]|uniref:DUF92 domain-containing protein n=1 Tax=Alkalihalobacillus sp. 1P02AB TaxID=3132260 RepID=UPI0039A70C94
MIVQFIGVLMLAIMSFWLKKLTLSGAICAVIVGFMISWGLGLNGLLILAAFFISSIVWSSLFKRNKENEVDKKDKARDGWQVLANGGVAAVLALLYGIFEIDMFLFTFIVSMAAATSDTWASEIGRLSRKKPIDVLSFQKVKQGTSGAMSLLGTMAAVVGSVFIVLFALSLWGYEVSFSVGLVLLLICAGFFGNLVDTYAGALIQIKYRCPNCETITEKTEHCQQKTVHYKGFYGFNNETINFLCTFSGPVFFFAIFGWLS